MLRYLVTDSRQSDSIEERLEQVSQALIQSVDMSEPPSFPQVWGQQKAEAQAQLTALPTEVRIDNRLSEEYTIIEVFTFDRVGLLYWLARKLHDLKLVIAHAKIGTYLDQVVDVFYVTDRQGNRLSEMSRLEEIRTELQELVQAD